MTVTELFYKLVEFFFSYFWHFIALEIFILTIQGHPKKMFAGIGGFFEGVKSKYRARVEKFQGFKKADAPEILKNYKFPAETKEERKADLGES
jgi:hypothetical protein